MKGAFFNGWMPAAKDLLVMEEGDRSECERILRSRKTAVNVPRRAEMLLLAARGLSNRQIALELGANRHVIGRVRKEYGQRGLGVLEDRPRAGSTAQPVVMSKVLKRVIETVCQAPAKGFRAGARGRWPGTSTFLRQPSTAFSGRINHSLIGCGPLALVRILNLERSCWR